MKYKLSEEELDAMIREASVDTYTDEEFFYGIAVTLEDSISFPVYGRGAW